MTFELPTRPFILVHVLIHAARLRTLRSTDRDGMGLAMQKRIDRAQDGWISYRPRDWTDNPQTPQSLKEFTRFLNEHEQAGLVEIDRDRTNRPLWVRLTAVGETEANRIAATEKIEVPKTASADSYNPLQYRRNELACFRKCAEHTRERIALYERDLEGYRTPGYTSEFVTPEDASRIPRWLQADRDRLEKVETEIETMERKVAALELEDKGSKSDDP